MTSDDDEGVQLTRTSRVFSRCASSEDGASGAWVSTVTAIDDVAVFPAWSSARTLRT